MIRRAEVPAAINVSVPLAQVSLVREVDHGLPALLQTQAQPVHRAVNKVCKACGTVVQMMCRCCGQVARVRCAGWGHLGEWL